MDIARILLWSFVIAWVALMLIGVIALALADRRTR